MHLITNKQKQQLRITSHYLRLPKWFCIKTSINILITDHYDLFCPTYILNLVRLFQIHIYYIYIWCKILKEVLTTQCASKLIVKIANLLIMADTSNSLRRTFEFVLRISAKISELFPLTRPVVVNVGEDWLVRHRCLYAYIYSYIYIYICM